MGGRGNWRQDAAAAWTRGASGTTAWPWPLTPGFRGSRLGVLQPEEQHPYRRRLRGAMLLDYSHAVSPHVHAPPHASAHALRVNSRHSPAKAREETAGLAEWAEARLSTLSLTQPPSHRALEGRFVA